MTSTATAVLHPIRPELVPRLDPAFVEIYNKFLANIPLTNRVPVAEIREGVTSFKRFPGGRSPVAVAEIRELTIPGASGALRAKIFIPNSTSSDSGPLPVFVFYTHGGFVVCGLDVDDGYCTRMAQGAQCIVITAEYARSPEKPYPAAIDDAWAVLLWTFEHAKEFHGDPSRMAVGGMDAGATIAAIMTHMATSSHISGLNLCFQCLLVPIIDATAVVGDKRYPSWKEFEYAPCLPAEKQVWNRQQYLGMSPGSDILRSWKVSPIYAKNWNGVPPAFIGTAEIDILRDEGEAYGIKLQQEGIAVQAMRIKGVAHPMVSMDEAIVQCKALVEASISAVRTAFS